MSPWQTQMCLLVQWMIPTIYYPYIRPFQSLDKGREIALLIVCILKYFKILYLDLIILDRLFVSTFGP